MKFAGEVLNNGLIEIANKDIADMKIFYANNERVLRLAKTVLILVELNKKLTEQRNRYTPQGICELVLDPELDEIVRKWEVK